MTEIFETQLSGTLELAFELKAELLTLPSLMPKAKSNDFATLRNAYSIISKTIKKLESIQKAFFPEKGEIDNKKELKTTGDIKKILSGASGKVHHIKANLIMLQLYIPKEKIEEMSKKANKLSTKSMDSLKAAQEYTEHTRRFATAARALSVFQILADEIEKVIKTLSTIQEDLFPD